MAGGYPNLFPSGFLEFDDTCSGPILYRNQPSRENSFAPTLNDFMNKYVTADLNDDDMVRMLTYLKFFSRKWKKLPPNMRNELIHILENSNSELGARLSRDTPNMNVEHFGESESEESMVDSINNFLKAKNVDNIKVISSDNRSSIFVIVVIAISAIVLGFLIACC